MNIYSQVVVAVISINTTNESAFLATRVDVCIGMLRG